MKKGAISAGVLIGFIIFLVALAAVFVFWSQFNPQGVIDEEICHESIVLRSTFNVGPVQAGKNIPLNCRTKKVCLSESGGPCEIFNDIPGKSPVERVKLEGDIKKQVIDEIGDLLYDCHAVLGEGKLDFLPHGFASDKYCLVCSRFAVDDGARRELSGGISYDEFYKRLENREDKEGRKYLSFIYPGWTDASQARQLFEEVKKREEFDKNNQLTYEDWKLDFNTSSNVTGYAVIAQVVQHGEWKAYTAGAGVALGGILVAVGILSIPFSGPVGAAIASFGSQAVLAGTATASSATFIYNYPDSSEDRDYDYFSPAIFPYNAETLASLKCDSFEFAA